MNSKQSGPTSFQEAIQQAPINISHAALLFAREIAYPNLDTDQYLLVLDQLSSWAQRVVPPTGPLLVRARHLSEFIFRKFHFQGNISDYNDPRNSFLNEVLERRLGIPISLSVIYLHIARRVGLPAEGVALPGHFIVSVPRPEGDLYYDPFNGGRRLTQEDCARLVELTSGHTGPLKQEWLAPASPVDILSRMLTNLKISYVQGNAWELAQRVVERLITLRPDEPEHVRDLGLMYYQTDSLRLCVQYLEQYLLRAPQAPDAEQVREYLQSAAQRLAQLN